MSRLSHILYLLGIVLFISKITLAQDSIPAISLADTIKIVDSLPLSDSLVVKEEISPDTIVIADTIPIKDVTVDEERQVDSLPNVDDLVLNDSIQIPDTIIKVEPLTSIQYLDTFFVANPPQSFDDTVFYNAYSYLKNFTGNDSIQAMLNYVYETVNKNWANNEIRKLERFYDSVLVRKQNYDSILATYREKQLLVLKSDTGTVSTSDSLFLQVIDAIQNPDSINYDSLLSIPNIYNDSLLLSIEEAIQDFRNNEMVAWIQKVRRDTFDFYLIDANDDSTLIRLYKNNPRMLAYQITDYWGKPVDAVVRDIEPNSMRILINDTPEAFTNRREQAKKAMSYRKGIHIDNMELTVKPYKIPSNAKPWTIYGNSSLDLSQVGMNEYWTRGGEPSLSFIAGLEMIAKYKKKKSIWDNQGLFRYGVIRQGYFKDESATFKPSVDRLEVNSKYGYSINAKSYLSILGTFRSQFFPAYNYEGSLKTELNSEFFSPAYVTFSLGYDFKPDARTSLFVSPIADKSTFVLNNSVDQTQYGLDSTQSARHEFGFSFNARHKMKVWGDIEMQNQLKLFTNYLENPQNVDVEWEFQLTLPINEFIRVTVQSYLIYDDNVSIPVYEYDATSGARVKTDRTTKNVQFKELTTLGFAINF